MVIVELIIAGCVCVLGVYLWYLLSFLPHQRMRAENGEVEVIEDDKGRPKQHSCPLCGTVLRNGERVKSEVFPGGKDRLTHIYGCPYCYPPNASVKRICPVCLKEVPREGKVIARMFTSPGRKHIHVLGCSSCRNM